MVSKWLLHSTDGHLTLQTGRGKRETEVLYHGSEVAAGNLQLMCHWPNFKGWNYSLARVQRMRMVYSQQWLAQHGSWFKVSLTGCSWWGNVELAEMPTPMVF